MWLQSQKYIISQRRSDTLNVYGKHKLDILTFTHLRTEVLRCAPFRCSHKRRAWNKFNRTNRTRAFRMQNHRISINPWIYSDNHLGDVPYQKTRSVATASTCCHGFPKESLQLGIGGFCCCRCSFPNVRLECLCGDSHPQPRLAICVVDKTRNYRRARNRGKYVVI